MAVLGKDGRYSESSYFCVAPGCRFQHAVQERKSQAVWGKRVNVCTRVDDAALG